MESRWQVQGVSSSPHCVYSLKKVLDIRYLFDLFDLDVLSLGTPFSRVLTRELKFRAVVGTPGPILQLRLQYPASEIKTRQKQTRSQAATCASKATASVSHRK